MVINLTYLLEPVPQGTPTMWCSRMVVTAKKKLVTQIFAVQNVNDVYIHHISYPIIDND